MDAILGRIVLAVGFNTFRLSVGFVVDLLFSAGLSYLLFLSFEIPVTGGRILTVVGLITCLWFYLDLVKRKGLRTALLNAAATLVGSLCGSALFAALH